MLIFNTGRYFGFQYLDVVPDDLTSGKPDRIERNNHAALKDNDQTVLVAAVISNPCG